MCYSVIIPVYNKGRHVARTIQSVLNQSYQRFELIVVDDGSTDDSLNIIKSFKDKRIKIIENNLPHPGGPAFARNLGVKEASFDWVCFLDADDEWSTNFLLKMDALHSQFPDASILSCGWKSVYLGGAVKPDKYYMQHSAEGNHSYNMVHYLKCSVVSVRPIWTSVAVVNKDILLKSGMFPETGRWRGEDVDTWLRIMMRAEAIGAWGAFEGAIYHRDSDNMLTQNVAPVVRGNHMLRSIKIFLKNESDPEVRALLLQYRHHIYCSTIKTQLEVYFITFSRKMLGIKLADKLIKKIVTYKKNKRI